MKTFKATPSQQELRDLFYGDFINGELIHKPRQDGKNCASWNTRYAGRAAGNIMKNSYVVVEIHNERHYVHRLIWKLVTGREPMILDHINRDRSDNRFENLREATDQQNGYNQGRRRNNTSGHKGIWWHNKNATWCVEVATPEGRFRKSFVNVEDAIAAKEEAIARYHGEYGCLD